MPNHLFHPDQVRFPDRRSNGGYLSPKGLRAMLQASLAGTRFASEFPVIDLGDTPARMAFHTDLRERGGEALAAYREQYEDPFCAMLMRVAFAIGAHTQLHTNDMYGFTGPETHFFAVEAQQDLAILCRALCRDEKRALYQVGEMLGFEDGTWIPMMTGADAVAKFVVAAQSGGGIAYLPTAKEDAHNGIDVLLQIGISGLCVQVKSQRDASGITLEQIMREPSGPGSRQIVGDPRRTWLGTIAFNKKYNVTWNPATAIVGRDSDSLVLRFGVTQAAA